MGKVVSKVAGVGKNLLFGKKDPGVADSFISNPALVKSRQRQQELQDIFKGEIAELKGDDTKKLTQLELAKGERGFQAAAEDARRRAQQEVAKRGLGGSSVGLSSVLTADRGILAERDRFRASAPEIRNRIRAQRLGLLGAAGQGVSGIADSISRSSVFKQGRESRGRSGGLARIGLTVAGGLKGGSQGAQIGSSLGSQVANL